MAPIPEEMTTARAIVLAYEAGHRGSGRPASEDHRPHLGASLIGHECDRAIWYTFRWVFNKPHPGRLLRLFDSGHLQEPRLIADLRATGAEVYDNDPSTGKQFEVWTHGGHFGGSMDGCGKGFVEAPKTWHVTEFKTHSEKSFVKLKKDGVVKAKPRHHAQMQVYMGLTEMTRAIYVAVNKNDDDIYTERVSFDKDLFERLVAKALRIIKCGEPPARCSDDPSWYECRVCDFKDVCHGRQAPEVNCRTCAHSTPVIGGGHQVWKCDSFQADIPLDAQRVGCESHRYIPILLVKAGKPVDYHDGDVVYETEDGRRWANGVGQGAIDSGAIHEAGVTSFLPDLAAARLQFPNATLKNVEEQ